jgi:glutaredoxin-like protein NrdH
VKAWLSREGVPFTVKDVEEDANAYDELIARGFRTVPVTIAGEVAVKGFDESRLRAALTGAGSTDR